jgi:predicted DNA binding CopG/RHH family protein
VPVALGRAELVLGAPRCATIRLGKATVAYFKGMSSETGIPYQNLINLYLRECTMSRKKLRMKWVS